MKRILLLAGIMAAVQAPAAKADVLDTVNWARLRGCNVSVARPALRENSKLQKAVRRLAGGTALRQALSAEGYLASESAELHLSGAVNDAQISRMLTANYCRTLSDPKFREAGALQRGAEVWVVIAAPVAVPAAADAEAVSRGILEIVNAARAAGRRCGTR